MSSFLGPDDCGKPRLERGYDRARVVHRQRGLGDEGEVVVIFHREFLHIVRRFHQIHARRPGDLAHGAFHFGVALVAYHHDFLALLAHARHFDMHLGHQRTGGVEHGQPARLGLVAHRLRNPVGAEDKDAAGRHVGKFFDEHRALGLEAIHHEFVVHHFVAHVDRRAMQRQRALDDLDGAVHPGAKTTRIGKQQFHSLSSNAGRVPRAILKLSRNGAHAAPCSPGFSASGVACRLR